MNEILYYTLVTFIVQQNSRFVTKYRQDYNEKNIFFLNHIFFSNTMVR